LIQRFHKPVNNEKQLLFVSTELMSVKNGLSGVLQPVIENQIDAHGLGGEASQPQPGYGPSLAR
jgi:hypothetical protein